MKEPNPRPSAPHGFRFLKLKIDLASVFSCLARSEVSDSGDGGSVV